MIRFLSRARNSELTGRALLRLDFNTEDDWRLRTAVPTVKFLEKHSRAVIILSHRGRPAFSASRRIRRGKPLGFDKKLSLKKDALKLGRFIGRRVTFIGDFNFKKIKKTIGLAPKGSVFLLENLRFLKGEEENSPVLAKNLASLGDFYVNDAFAVSHRENASVSAIARRLPSFAGFGLEREIKTLGQIMARPRRPLVLVVGGSKAADKLGVMDYFKNKADWFLLGGGPANTFLYLRGVNVGNSVRDRNPAELKKLKKLTYQKNIVVPADYKRKKDKILDIGPKTVRIFEEKIKKARTIIWSGPMGLAEKKKFARGNLAVAQVIAKNRRAFSVTGGGETVMFLKKYKLDKKFSFISTGGTAMLDYLAGKKLPGVAALDSKPRRFRPGAINK